MALSITLNVDRDLLLSLVNRGDRDVRAQCGREKRKAVVALALQISSLLEGPLNVLGVAVRAFRKEVVPSLPRDSCTALLAHSTAEVLLEPLASGVAHPGVHRLVLAKTLRPVSPGLRYTALCAHRHTVLKLHPPSTRGARPTLRRIQLILIIYF